MKKIDWEAVFVITGTIILVLLVVALVILQIYCWIEYGNKPIQETPNWVNWLMYRRNK